jgi:Trypsin-like peptidase domain
VDRRGELSDGMAFGGVPCVIAGNRFHIITRTLIAVMIVAWPAAPELQIYSRAAAAEVDAVGAPAPVGFAAIVERVKPAVVGVRVKVEGGVQLNDAQQRNPIPPGVPSEGPVSRFDTVLGSGFFISGDGYVVTNNHVVANGLAFEVTVENGETYDAKVIGADPQTDLALIKVTANVDFPYVRLAAAEAHIGPWTRYRCGSVRRIHSDRRTGESRKFRGPHFQRQGRSSRSQHRDIFAFGRICRHCVRYSGGNRQTHRPAT